jgi:hypothetical protein
VRTSNPTRRKDVYESKSEPNSGGGWSYFQKKRQNRVK